MHDYWNTILRCFLLKRFKDFTKKEICNAHKNTEVLIAIDASREK
jgi:predicted lactoylglutathione lyase